MQVAATDMFKSCSADTSDAQTQVHIQNISKCLMIYRTVLSHAKLMDATPVRARRMPVCSLGTLGSITPGVSIKKAVGRSPTLHQDKRSGCMQRNDGDWQILP